MSRLIPLLALPLLFACDRTPEVPVDASEGHGLPEVIDELPTTALDEQGVGLDLELRFTHCDQGRLYSGGGATAQTHALAVGDRGRALVSGGAFVAGRWRPEDGLEIWTARDLSLDDVVTQSAPHVWIIDATRRPSRRPGEYTFDVAYEHRVAEQVDEPRVEASGSFEVSLGEGESLPLDALPIRGGDPGCRPMASVALVPHVGEMGPATDERILQYELWFVDEAPDGTTKWTHATFGGLHGERVGYRLPPVRLPIELGGAARDLLFGSDGGLRGRWRDDGTVDLIVEGVLWHSLVDPGEGRKGGFGQSGKHAFRVEPGRVLRLEFDTSGGTLGVKGADGQWSNADLDSLRAGHRTALLVSVKQAQAHG